MADQKILVPKMGDFKNVEIIEVLVKPGQKINLNSKHIYYYLEQVHSVYSQYLKRVYLGLSAH